MRRDKPLTIRQTMDEIHRSYDSFEALAKQALREEFGFGSVRLARFEARFAELAARECERIEVEMRRRSRR